MKLAWLYSKQWMAGYGRKPMAFLHLCIGRGSKWVSEAKKASMGVWGWQGHIGRPVDVHFQMGTRLYLLAYPTNHFPSFIIR